MAYRALAVHTDADQERVNGALETRLLREGGVEVRGRRCRSDDEVIELAREADFILNGLVPITRKVLESVPRCQVVARYGVGYDNVDLDAATEQGIAVVHVPDFCTEEVSNHAIGFILAWAKQLVPYNDLVHRGQWGMAFAASVRSVHQETLGIVGAGRIGLLTARKARALSMSVIAFDAFVKPDALKKEGVEPVSLPDLLARSDYVSVHTPLNAQTRHLIGRDQLRAMKPTAVLINTSRGPVVDEAALIEALQEKRIAAAALDVFEKEPLPPDSPLRSMPNVLMTPHTGAQSPVATVRLRRSIAQEVLRALRGEFPLNVANPSVRQNARLLARA